MEQFEAQVESLNKESNELITNVIQSLITVVKEAQKSPQLVALVIAKRFVEEKDGLFLSSGVFVRCFGAARHSGVNKNVINLVLQELWPLLYPLLEGYRLPAHAALKEKVQRIVRRWQQRQRLDPKIVEELLNRMDPPPPAVEKKEEDKPSTKENKESSGAVVSLLDRGYSQAQVQNYREVLRNCVRLMEQLPPARATAYAEVISQERLSGPTPTAIEILKGVLVELRREVHQGTMQQTEGPATTAVEREEGEEARVALGRLLNQLQQTNQSTTTVSTVNHPYTVHYTHPLFNDVAQNRSVGQRSGFGDLRPHPLSSSSGDNYYPRRGEGKANPFRVPVDLVRAGVVRRAFPSPQEWLEAKDMASLALYEARVSNRGANAKRARDDANQRE
ncbi:hypothetical protein AGDE_11143 [Angomonas deanei]|nr:hypothetical protein AGDE_11143 [Angomonas deanei]|eukprot:EPY26686.1 hypothetical protein AGDE_11143 [Angomonas deanei]